MEIQDSLDNIKGTILVNFKWLPSEIDKLELQDKNYNGLFFIYNEILKEIARTNKAPE